MKHPRCNREPERQEPSRNKLRAGVKCGFSRKGDGREDQSVIYRQSDMGKRAYPETQELLITADAGGSNAARSRVRKLELQRFAGRTGITVSVSHFPPGTSKWNKIQHRLFCHITENWRGRPLTAHETVVQLIGSVRTTLASRQSHARHARISDWHQSHG